MDWKDQLSSLRSQMDDPKDEDVNPIEEKESKGSEKKSVVSVITDKKGRNGKIATIVEGFNEPDEEVEEIARKLKQRLGTGGSCRGGEILIQGDRKKEVTEFLKGLGYGVR